MEYAFVLVHGRIVAAFVETSPSIPSIVEVAGTFVMPPRFATRVNVFVLQTNRTGAEPASTYKRTCTTAVHVGLRVALPKAAVAVFALLWVQSKIAMIVATPAAAIKSAAISLAPLSERLRIVLIVETNVPRVKRAVPT